MSRLDPEEARQGEKGTPILRILVIALVLCVIGGAVFALYPWPDQTLPEADVGGGLGSPSATTTPPGGNTTVAPQTPGPSSPNGSNAN
jgi:hypothetical protein